MFNKVTINKNAFYEEEMEKQREMLLSLAKELGYEYKSRAVKRMNFCSHLIPCDCPKEEAVLEWYWSPIERPDKPYDTNLKWKKECEVNWESWGKGYHEGYGYATKWMEGLISPKKSSKKKLK